MKLIIYQIFTRLWGNLTEQPVFNGDKAQNGCGTMDDVTARSLSYIKGLGVTHVWYTGLLRHATTTDYSDTLGLEPDHSAMVKGKAGSPYAVKDYYDLDPDLARVPKRRMDAFERLVKRTHTAGLKVVMDFVPNHVARQYRSTQAPEGVRSLGEGDDTACAFSPQNNFYYLPGQTLHCTFDMKGNAKEPYREEPARATGNDCFHASPGVNDWYETVKLNYGVDYLAGGAEHFDPLPATWMQMRDILLFWAGKGVDAFRCDMAEMVPVAFWHWVTREVRNVYPDVLFIGEVYNPGRYRDFIHHGGFDYLYDKVGLYDALRDVVCGRRPASCLTGCWQAVDDIQCHMLNFIENHDEQRFASDFYAGDALKAEAPLMVAACMNTNPAMVYFAEELGERGMDCEGFSGRDGRTTIFDYWSVPTLRQLQRDGVKSLAGDSLKSHTFHKQILNLARREKALAEGAFFDVMYANYANERFNSDVLFAFLRKAGDELVLAVANFSAEAQTSDVVLPGHAFDCLDIAEGDCPAAELLHGKARAGKQTVRLRRDGAVPVAVPPYGAALLKIKLNQK